MSGWLFGVACVASAQLAFMGGYISADDAPRWIKVIGWIALPVGAALLISSLAAFVGGV